MIVKKEITIAGKTITLETGKFAPQTNQAVLARMGDTVVLVTVVAVPPREGTDFFPLRVDYEEKLYAGGFLRESRAVKHEGPPSDQAIVTGRLIDHAIRPLFPKDYMDEVQVTATVLSYDETSDPGILAFIGASAALTASDIPWNGPTTSLRLALNTENEPVINPAKSSFEDLIFNSVITFKDNKVQGIEAEGKEIVEERIVELIKTAMPEFEKLADFIKDFAKEVGKAKYHYTSYKVSDEILKDIHEFAGERIHNLVVTPMDKPDFVVAYEALLTEIYKNFEGKYKQSDMKRALDEVEKKEIRELVLKEGKRVDGRRVDEIRPLDAEIGLLPRVHGSAFFSRGITQALSIVTLGPISKEMLIQTMGGDEHKQYIHHYYGRPFSLGEIGAIKSPGRREVGHGALAEKAIAQVLPSKEEFPYTIRVATEILSQNGSTSMASTCGSSLALMDAGVPIKAPVGGLSIGLIPTEDESQSVLLVDIVGTEDANGAMDFKMTGTEKGMTAIQMELKINGISLDLLTKTLELSRQKRMEILEFMKKFISTPRTGLSKYAPTITTLKIDPKLLGEVIGPSGKVIKNIVAVTGANIDTEDDGTIYITAGPEADAEKAKKMIEAIVKKVQPGEIYDGEVKRILEFGAFVEILPGKEGLVHISELAPQHVDKVEDVVNVGDKVKVKVKEIDNMGRINLSIRALLPGGDQERTDTRESRPQTNRPRPGGPSYRTPFHQRPGYKRF